MKNNVFDLSDWRESKQQVLERLFSEHGAALRSFLRGRLGLAGELDDIVQEVFLKLANIDNLCERMAAGRGNNRAFIFTVANNLVVDLERQKTVRRHYDESEKDNAGSVTLEVTPETILVAEQELDIVKRTIMLLTPNCRQVFVLNRFKHQSYQQIADQMGVSVKQIEKYMSTALVKIRDAVYLAKGVE